MSRKQFSLLALLGATTVMALAAALIGGSFGPELRAVILSLAAVWVGTLIVGGILFAFFQVTARLLTARFRIVHLLYATALLASSMATFGGAGIAPGIVFVGFWAVVFTSQSRPRMLLNAVLILLLGCCFIGLMLPAFSSAPQAARRMRCSNNLKQILLAMHNYYDDHGSFPPAFVADDKGRPIHSWRVLLLPYLENEPLYRKYDFSEPWDGPNNRKLQSSMPYVFACPSQSGTTMRGRSTTGYVAAIGPSTAWPGSRGRKKGEFKDGMSDTIAVVELAGSHICWMEPSDPTIDEVLKIVSTDDPDQSGGHRHENFFYVQFSGRNTAMVDSSIHFIRASVNETTWKKLLQIDDGTELPDTGQKAWREPPKRLKWGNCFRLAIFVVLVFLPLPWVWLNPESGVFPRPSRVSSSSIT